MKAHFIIYVDDQQKSTLFYAEVLATGPVLDVPGMTEFALSSGCVLGIMPESGIILLHGDGLPDPRRGPGIPRAELYLKVEDPGAFHQRALAGGAKQLSPLLPRDWNDLAAYSLDPDGHVLAFASACFRDGTSHLIQSKRNAEFLP